MLIILHGWKTDYLTAELEFTSVIVDTGTLSVCPLLLSLRCLGVSLKAVGFILSGGCI